MADKNFENLPGKFQSSDLAEEISERKSSIAQEKNSGAAKKNLSLEKTPMPEQAANVRNKNFEEVALGYSHEMAILEARRCLDCKNKPCVSGCPVGVPIPDFIRCILDDDLQKAYEIITSMNSLPAVCGRVCPQETQCEAKCVRGIKGQPVGIGYLERFVADWFFQNGKKSEENISKNGLKVAVLGSGPSGLVCAGDLAKLGYDVTIFEALHMAGGVLTYGIPEFRLPKAIVAKEIEQLEKLGVKINTNFVAGKTILVEELFEMGFEALYIATGAGLPNFLGIDGEGLQGVYSANEFLTRVNLMKAYLSEYDTPIAKHKNVAVVGGGNVAMDAARCAKRLGSENVYVIYRRSREEMPARREEILHAEAEGIIFKFLSNPVKIWGDSSGKTEKIECTEMALGEPDKSGRRRPVPKANSNFFLEVDSVIVAIGNSPNPLVNSSLSEIKTNEKGCLVIDDDTMQTSVESIYAGGDAVTGAATVILAMGSGKRAAKSIDEYLKYKAL